MSDFRSTKLAVESELRRKYGEDYRPIWVLAEYKKGRFVHKSDDQPLEFPEGTVVQMAVYGNSFKIGKESPSLTREGEVPFLGKGENLYYGVHRKSVTENLDAFKSWDDYFVPLATLDPEFPIRNQFKRDVPELVWLEFVLEEEARLKIVGDKDPSLCPCKVRVPALDVEARSINQAVSLAVRMTQPWRTSTSVNVFRHVVAVRDGAPQLLEWLRAKKAKEWNQLWYGPNNVR